MKYQKLPYNETIIIYNGLRYVLERVVDVQPNETGVSCRFCDLQDICIKGNGNLKLIELCMPNHVGYDCCFHVDIDHSGNKIHDIAP